MRMGSITFKKLVVFVVLSSFGNGCVEALVAVPCEDEDPTCPQLAEEGACHGKGTTGLEDVDVVLGSRTLSRCRVSCRRREEEMKKDEEKHKDELSVLAKFGGTGDLVESLFGGQVSICDLDKEWTSDAREQYLAARFDAVTYLTSDNYGPRRHTEAGFAKERVPRDLWEFIKGLHQEVKGNWTKEDCDRGLYHCFEVKEDDSECSLSPRPTALVAQLDTGQQWEIAEGMRGRAEEWAGVELKSSNVYGFRRYLRGAKVGCHTDVISDKVISAIINVDQDADAKPWPLDILDHTGAHHRVELEPGDLLWYESAKLPHGREATFEGEYYDNLFVHYFPAWYEGSNWGEIMHPGSHKKGIKKK